MLIKEEGWRSQRRQGAHEKMWKQKDNPCCIAREISGYKIRAKQLSILSKMADVFCNPRWSYNWVYRFYDLEDLYWWALHISYVATH